MRPLSLAVRALQRVCAAACGLALLACAALAACALSAGSAYAFTLDANDNSPAANNGFAYYFDDDALVLVVPGTDAYSSSDATLEIPAQLKDPDTGQVKAVVRVKGPARGAAGYNAGHAYLGVHAAANTKIKHLVLPRSLTSLDEQGSFQNLWRMRTTALETVSFAEEGTWALRTIGANQFSSSVPLKSFNAGTVGGVAYDCVIPPSVRTLGSDGMVGMNGSTFASVYVPASVTSLDGMFLGADLGSMRTVTSESSVYPEFVQYAPNAASVSVAGGITRIGGLAGSGFESYDIPSTVTVISDYAFSNCANLKHITLPAGLVSIGDSAFSGCTSLESVTFLGQGLTEIGKNAFQGDARLTQLNLPDSVASIGPSAFAGTGIAQLKLPARLCVGFNTGHFGEYAELGDAQIYNTPLFVRSAFTNTYELDDPASRNTTLESADLSACEQSYLPPYLLANCTALKEVSISSSVQQLMSGVFFNCTSLEDVYYFGDVQNLAITETERISGGFGDSDKAGAFAWHSNGFDDDNDEVNVVGEWKNRSGITFYGVALSDNNKLMQFAAANGCAYKPFVFVGGGGSAPEVVEKFGYAVPDSALDVACAAGQVPTITASFAGDSLTRVLVPGRDCTVTYANAATGQSVAGDAPLPAGTWTATITGDGKSVWGTTTLEVVVN